MKDYSEFKAGKKYTCTDFGDSESVVLCIGHSSEGIPVIEYRSGAIHRLYSVEDWKEYKEPREVWILGHLVFDTAKEAEKHRDEWNLDSHEIIRYKEVFK